MRDEKTRSFVIDGKSNFVNNLTTRQLKTIQSDRQINEHKTIRQQFNDIKNGAQDTRKISQINPFVSYFPRFYTKEIRNAFILFILWICLLFIGFALFGFGLYSIISSSDSNWLCLLLVPPLLIMIGLCVVYTSRYFNFRSEAKTINFKDEKTLSINVQRLYKRLKTGYINVNWMCLTSYVVFGLFILFVFVVGKILNGSNINFGQWDPRLFNGDHIYEILFFSGLIAIIFTVIQHVGLLICNYLRAARIENFYNFMIVDQEELNLIKKSKNKRDLIIFLTSCLIIGIIIYFVYKLIRKRKTTKIVAG